MALVSPYILQISQCSNSHCWIIHVINKHTIKCFTPSVFANIACSLACLPLPFFFSSFLPSFRDILIYLFNLFIKRKRGEKRGWETSSHMRPHGRPNPQPRHVPWPESNQPPFALQDDEQPTEQHWSGLSSFIKSSLKFFSSRDYQSNQLEKYCQPYLGQNSCGQRHLKIVKCFFSVS